MGDYKLGWFGLYNFLKMHGLTHFSDAFLTLITMSSSKFTFSKKFGAPVSIFWFDNNMEAKSFKM